MNGEVLSKADVVKTWKGYPDTARQVKALVEAGWTAVRQGRHCRLICPCGEADMRVSCTPQNDGNHARRLQTSARKCPDQHRLVH